MSSINRKKNAIRIHENYHEDTRSQTKIIGENNFTYRTILSVINRYLKSREKILDIGCGAGTIDLYLANKGHRLLGIDISINAISSCIKSAENLRMKNIKFKQVNFPNETINDTFDLIIFSEVIEHLQDDEYALNQIYKLLKKGGLLIITTPSLDAPLHKWGLTEEFDKRVGHVRRYKLDHLLGILHKSGFTIKESMITEGPLRNFLFTNPAAGKSIRYFKYFISDIVTLLDNLSVKFFGGSDIIIVATRG